MRKTLAFVGVLVAIGLGPLAPHAQADTTSLHCGSPEDGGGFVNDTNAAAALLALANRDRAAAGLVPLAHRADAAVIAEAHARVMALAGRIFHNDGFFASSVKAALGTRYQGENVGCHPDVEWSHAAFMNSPHHRENLMNPRFNQAGFAVIARRDGQLYVVQSFLEGSGAPAPAPAPVAPPAPAPAAAPAPAPAAAPAPAPAAGPKPEAAAKVSPPPATTAVVPVAPTTAPATIPSTTTRPAPEVAAIEMAATPLSPAGPDIDAADQGPRKAAAVASTAAVALGTVVLGRKRMRRLRI